MKITALNLDWIKDRDQLITLEVVLSAHLSQFSKETVANAAPTSAIERARTLRNQVQNLLHGNHLNYNINRTPLLAYKQEAA